MKTLKISVLSVLLTIFVLMGVTWVFAQGSEIIHACVAKDGALRIVALDGQCKSKETPLSWNIQGEQGPAGVLGFYTVQSETDILPPAALNKGATARCSLGDKVTGGGYRYITYNEDGSTGIVFFSGQNLLVNGPVSADLSQDLGEGWTVHITTNSPNLEAHDVILEVSAICADLTP